MAHDLVLRDHRALHGAVARTALAGVGVGLLQFVAHGPLVDAASLLALGVATVPPRSPRSLALVGTLAALGAGALRLPPTLAVPSLALLAGAHFAAGTRGIGRRLAAAASGAVAAAVAALVAGGLLLASAPLFDGALAWLPGGLGALLACGAGGFLAGFGVLGREIERVPSLPRPPPGSSLPALAASPEDAEVGELLARAAATAGEIERALGGSEPRAAATARALAAKIGAFATRFRELHGQLARIDRASLVERLERLSARARAATDEEVRADYRRAEAALREQLEDLDAIGAACDRALGRLHLGVAVLERLRLAGLHHRSADAGWGAVELAPLVDELLAAGRDLDAGARTLAELPPA